MKFFRAVLMLYLLFAVTLASDVFAQQAETDASAETPAAAAAEEASAFQSAIADAEQSGEGNLVAYRKGDSVMLAIDAGLTDRLIMWYAEAARYPPGAVKSNAIGTTVIRLERQGSRLLIRDLIPSLSKRGGDDPLGEVHGPVSDAKITPIDLAVEAAALGPVIAQLPIVAEEDGKLLVDITAAFSNDFDTLTAIPHILAANVAPMPYPLTIDATRSYIAEADVYPGNLHIRSHLTFRTIDPLDPSSGPHPVSIEVGHSLVLLPETPMAARRYDDRVGFFMSEYTEFETARGAVTGKQRLINRFRLEKADPEAAVSDPVEPIVFYIGQGVPERWRPYIAAGIESWQPAFEAAGFSNAIIAKQAPTPAEDPDWNPEDARFNVIRWVPQEMANAMGPRVVDPRSGEILFAHILVWPSVINIFSDYYYLMASGLDPEVDGLPLSEEKQGQVLAYAVAHEVGHSIGLRHNHLASTTYTVAELRDPVFANDSGPNTSIMAYGRFNQAAQPGDGVNRVMAAQGPADFFAINWGYGVHGDTPEQEQAELDRLAAQASADRLKRWAAGEMPGEEAWMFDPRVLKENVSSERIEATRLGIAKFQRVLEGLDAAAGEDDQQFRSVYSQALSRQAAMLESVLRLVGGERVGEGEGARPAIVSAEEQRAAVDFLLNEGSQSFDIYLRPDLLLRADPVGGDRSVAANQAKVVKDLLSGPKLTLLQTQSRIDPEAYDVAGMAQDVTQAIWADLDNPPRWRQVQQSAYLDQVEQILAAQPDPTAAATARTYQALGYAQYLTSNMTASGADTLFPAYVRVTLPQLKARLQGAAASASDTAARLHLLAMAQRIDTILK